ncbi:MAG: DNA polymerase III subunit alpha [Dehalococcoidia bacterium]|nr:DNA polymerase III subunit alpha [Dehalococcoidia bacterium]
MFTHLHVHTEFSLLDGLGRVNDLLKRAKDLGMTSLAITDHGVMYGVIDFYLAAKAMGIKPIIGCEVYVAPNGYESRTSADKNSYHLVLLARNEQGYRNLVQLVTKAQVNGFYYKPRVDRGWLSEHHEGLIALSACINGEVPRLIMDGKMEEARESALWYKATFGDFFLELQQHDIPELDLVNKRLIDMGRELNIPLVATNDLHYAQQGDSFAHDVLLCIQTNALVSDQKRLRMSGDSFYMRSSEEMAELFAHVPEAIENTQAIVDLCDLRLEFDRLHLPDVDIPPGMSADDYLAQLCYEGLPAAYPQVTDDKRQRLDYELGVIKETQFAQYFLVVRDFVNFARSQDILYGVRGSAAGSIVLYCLGITDIDPLANNLVFERFLNIERKEMPDIDMDFQDDRRDEVIDYVAGKYGRDHVAQIITFGTLGAKAVIRDVGRALGMSYADVDRVAKLIPTTLHMTIDRALEETKELSELYEADSGIKHLIDTAKQLAGISRHASTHAAGIVISREPLTDHVPLQRPSKGEEKGSLMTQFAMENVARIGLLKMDFLGLTNLTIIARARKIISRTRKVGLNLKTLPLDDPKTFELLGSGETTGVFQLESSGMRRYVRELKPTSVAELAAMIALFRPGPLAHIPRFIDSKFGRVPITYIHPLLEPILESTYGVIVYQDQVLFIVQAVAGYSLGKADIFRKAMGKKIVDKMKGEREAFLAGAGEKGISEGTATQIFDLIEPFAGYAFNKAHASCYALLAYQTAYLKANYPAEYMAAVLSTQMDTSERVAFVVGECRRLGIQVLPPDVNRSDADFTIEEVTINGGGTAQAIRFGMGAIKNVGVGAVKALVVVREEEGPFVSIEDFCRRVDLKNLNKRALESLIKVGALDCLGVRGALLENLDRIVAAVQRQQKLKETGQASMFDLFQATVPVPMPSLALSTKDATLSEKLAWEKEFVGTYFSEHPFARAARDLAKVVSAFCGQITEEMAGQQVLVAGIVASARLSFTKEKRPFVAAVLEDLDGSLEVTVWSEVYEKTKDLWQAGKILWVRGKVRPRGDRVQVVCDEASPYMPREDSEADDDQIDEPVNGNGGSHRRIQEPGSFLRPATATYQIMISFGKSGEVEADRERMQQLFAVLRSFQGPDVVRLVVANGHGIVHLDLPGLTTSYCPILRQKVIELVGEDGLRVSENSA